MDINQAQKDYMDYVQLIRSPNTARSYKRGIDLFSEFILAEGYKFSDPISSLNCDHWIKFTTFLAKKKYRIQTMRAYLSGVNLFLDWLVTYEYIQSPEHTDIKRYEKARKMLLDKREEKVPRFPPSGEAEKIVEAIESANYDSPRLERDIALINILYSSGCRNSEAASLRVRDFDLKDCKAIVVGKGNKERYIYYSNRTVQALKAYWQARKFAAPNDPAFCRHDKGSPKSQDRHPISDVTVRNIVRQACMIAGVKDFTPHYFRHNLGIEIQAETGDLVIVKDILGHADTRTAEIYAKVYPERLRKAHNKIVNR